MRTLHEFAVTEGVSGLLMIAVMWTGFPEDSTQRILGSTHAADPVVTRLLGVVGFQMLCYPTKNITAACSRFSHEEGTTSSEQHWSIEIS